MRRLAAAGAAFVCLAAAAPASNPDPPVILALGDSVAFGMGAPAPEDGGYLAVLYGRLCGDDPECGRGDVINLARPGATSEDVRQSQTPRAVAVLSERAESESPVTLVTLTVGGNDLFNRLLADCRSGLTAGCRQSMREVFAAYGENLAEALAELRAAAPHVPIVTMTYYNPLGFCALSALDPTAQVVLEGGTQALSGFNDLIRVTAAATGTRVAEASGLLSSGDYVGGFDCIHPNADGHERIADAFLSALADPTY